MRVLAHYLFAVVVLTLYGGQVCPFVESLDVFSWALSVIVLFAFMYAMRVRLMSPLVRAAPCHIRVGRQFHLDVGLYILGGGLISLYNLFIHDFPIESGFKIWLGFILMGFYMGADSALSRERHVANDPACQLDESEAERLFPLTRKFAIVTVVLALSVSSVFLLVIVKDMEWLSSVDPANLRAAIPPVLAEVAFIMGVNLLLSLNLVISFSRNLKMFFHYENSTLMEVANGNLETAVPVATNDEFGLMALYTNKMISGLRALNAELSLTRDVTILSLASLAETRDNETGQHILRTQRYVKALAGHMHADPDCPVRFDPATIELLYKSAPLHDIGKVGIPDAILLKPGRHTAEEFEIMKHHARYGAEALERAEQRLGTNSFLRLAREIALTHHEKWDGSGYPAGLAGEEIPLAGRIMALADVYDALISRRVYKPAFPHDKAKEIILEGRGSHFDPAVVDAFVRVEEEFVRIAAAYRDAEASGA